MRGIGARRRPASRLAVGNVIRSRRGCHPERSEGSGIERQCHAALMIGADPSEYLRMTGWVGFVVVVVWVACASRAAEPIALPGTAALTMEGDVASQMVDGVDRFLMK